MKKSVFLKKVLDSEDSQDPEDSQEIVSVRQIKKTIYNKAQNKDNNQRKSVHEFDVEVDIMQSISDFKITTKKER